MPLMPNALQTAIANFGKQPERPTSAGGVTGTGATAPQGSISFSQSADGNMNALAPPPMAGAAKDLFAQGGRRPGLPREEDQDNLGPLFSGMIGML